MRALSDYKYLIFDVDDTLLNFYSAYINAQEDIAKKLKILMNIDNWMRNVVGKHGKKAG